MYIAIGKVIGTHGTRGYVKAMAYSGKPERFLKLNTIYVETESGIRGFMVEEMRLMDNCVLIKLKGIDTREAARTLVQQDLLLPESQKIDLPKNTYFIHDLIGLKVFDMNRGYLGLLEEVLVKGGNDVYLVRREGREILIPAVSEFVRTVDLKERRMIVKLIEGMIEEDAN